MSWHNHRWLQLGNILTSLRRRINIKSAGQHHSTQVKFSAPISSGLQRRHCGFCKESGFAVAPRYVSRLWLVSASTCLVLLTDTHTHTHRQTHVSAGTRKVKPFCILSNRWWDDSGISWTICKSNHLTPDNLGSISPGWLEFNVPFQHKYGYIRDDPASHHSVLYRPDAIPDVQPTVSMHWRQQTHNSTFVWHKRLARWAHCVWSGFLHYENCRIRILKIFS